MVSFIIECHNITLLDGKLKLAQRTKTVYNILKRRIQTNSHLIEKNPKIYFKQRSTKNSSKEEIITIYTIDGTEETIRKNEILDDYIYIINPYGKTNDTFFKYEHNNQKIHFYTFEFDERFVIENIKSFINLVIHDNFSTTTNSSSNEPEIEESTNNIDSTDINSLTTKSTNIDSADIQSTDSEKETTTPNQYTAVNLTPDDITILTNPFIPQPPGTNYNQPVEELLRTTARNEEEDENTILFKTELAKEVFLNSENAQETTIQEQEEEPPTNPDIQTSNIYKPKKSWWRIWRR